MAWTPANPFGTLRTPGFPVILSESGDVVVNRLCLTLGICGLAFMFWAGSARANDWSLPSLNPFGSAPPKRSNEPSTWTKMSNGTKNFFSKTYDVLTPWDTEAEKVQAKQKSRNARPLSNTGRAAPEKKSFLTSWWATEEKPKQPKTVSEWLSQPRP
jgi:hypothetical protein